MKNNALLKIMGIFMMIGAFMACQKDFLDTKPIGKLSVDAFYKTDDDALKALMATYDILQWMYARDWNSAYLVKTFPSDESLTGGGDSGDQPPYQELDIFTYSAGNPTITAVYQSCYYGIYRANMVINNVVAETDVRKQIVAEAKCLRAYFYFELVTMYGKVPLNLTELAPSEYAQPAAEVTAIYAQIEKDLKEAIEVLPLKSALAAEDKFRVSKGTAQTILGKAYLYQELWADAHSYLGQVIASNEYQLSNDFSTLFLVDQEFGVESIMEVSWVTSEGYDWGTFQWGGNRAMENNITWQLTGPRGDYFNAGTSGLIGGWGFNYPTSALYQAFVDAGDTYRKASTVWNTADLEAVGGGWSNPNAWGWDGCIRIKYATRMSETSNAGGAVPELNYGTNLRLLRYADVLLMAAEAKYRAGDEAGALVELNKVRDRAQLADVTASGEALFQAIVAERQLELAFEGVRFLDLIRWGLAPQVLGSKGFVTGKHELYPIPLDEIRNNPNIQQNPNY